MEDSSLTVETYMKQLIVNRLPLLLLITTIAVISIFQFSRNYDSLYLDTDLARDLGEISSILQGEHRLLGPILEPGLQASGIYYYIFIPGLLLSNNSPYSLIVTNQLISIIALVILGWTVYNGVKRELAWLVILIIGLSPWFIESSFHPGNGYTYILFLLAATSLSIQKIKYPIITGLLTGLSVALHPVSIALIGYHLILLLSAKSSARTHLKYFISLIIPSISLIYFELRHGFIILNRFINNSFHQPSNPDINIANLYTFSKFTTLPLLIIILLSLSILIFKFKKGKFHIINLFNWSIALIVTLIFLPTIPGRYMYSVIVFWTLGLIYETSKLVNPKILQFALTIWLLITINQSAILKPQKDASRNIHTIKSTVDYILRTEIINSNNKIGVLAITNDPPKVPQADDYRYFFRRLRIDVVDTNNLSSAHTLLIFDELGNFDVHNWQSWETDQFGAKTLKNQYSVNNKKVYIYEKLAD